MKSLLPAVIGLGAAFALPLPALAASGQIDSFGASATTVTEGTVVDFVVGYSIVTSLYQSGGSDLVEPAPQEGTQTWNLNWYYYEGESVSQVWLEAAGQNFSDYPSVPAGSGYSGSWSFSVLFPVQGSFDITLNGGWSGQVDYYSSSESASRDCVNSDPGGTDALACSGWTYSYYDYSDWYTVGGGLGPSTLRIDVLPAAVPEPSTAALLVAGAVLLRARRRLGLA